MFGDAVCAAAGTLTATSKAQPRHSEANLSSMHVDNAVGEPATQPCLSLIEQGVSSRYVPYPSGQPLPRFPSCCLCCTLQGQAAAAAIIANVFSLTPSTAANQLAGKILLLQLFH